MNTDSEWEEWGKNDPYFGVITHDKFRKKNLTSEVISTFFESGEQHINHVFRVIKHHLDEDFLPKKAVDFGCGTGRLVIPLAKRAEYVVGLDVSESMLKEAHKNCEKYAIKNVELLKSDDDLSRLEGSFDFIHSFIVFQHIPVERGRYIFKNLLSYLNEGGICAIQFTYAQGKCIESYGIDPKQNFRKFLIQAKRIARNFLPEKEPLIEMNSYNINEILFLIQLHGVKNFYVEYSKHGDDLGVFLYFQKPSMIVR